ncbi:MAG TPA: hypothetical protein VGD62_09615, partial [Acidobacteriaceae bacterium]
FTGKVEALPEGENGAGHAAASFSLQATVERTRVVVREVMADAVPATVVPKRVAWMAKQRRWVAAAAGVLACLAAWGGWRWSERPVPGDHHELVLADLENATGDADLDRALKTLLAIDLNQSPWLLVAGESDTRKVLRLMDLPADAGLSSTLAREVCERLNDQAVLSPGLTRIGQRYLFTLVASDCSSGRSLAQVKAVAETREGVIQAVDKAAEQMQKKLGEPLRARGGASQPLLLAHTFSLEALKAYSQARGLHIRLKFAQAVPLYQKAIHLDPSFTDAYAQLANCFYNMGEALEGRKAMARAYELRDHADEPTRLRIVAMYEYWRTGDRHQAIRNYQDWTRLYPLATNPWVMLGEFEASVGRMDLAVDAARHAVANNPRATDAAEDLARWLRSDGQLEAAKAVCREAFRRGLDSTGLHRTLLDVAFVEHDTAALDEQRKWYRDKAEEDDAEGLDADLDASQGRMRSAVAHWEHLADVQRKNGLEEAALEMFSGVPEAEAETGLMQEARAHLRRFEASGALTGASMSSVIVGAAEAGVTALAEKKLKYMLDNGREDSDVQEVFAPEGRAALALATARPEQALADLEPAEPYRLTDSSVPALRGAAYLAAKQPVAAQREFRLVIDRPYTSAISPNVPLAHLGLARALVMQGNLDAAREEYQTLLTLWKGADQDLPVLVEARAEAARLH